MFHLDPPGIYELIRDNNILHNEAFSRLRKDQVVIISVAGTCKFHDDKGYKKAFRLVLDSFGSPTLFKENVEKEAQDSKNKDGHNSKSSKIDVDDEDSENVPEKSKKVDEDKHIVGCIDGFYSEDEGIIFMHLQGAYDPKAFLTEWKKLSSVRQNKGFNEIWTEIKSNYYRSLLLIFSLSHVVIISSTACYFDTNYIHTFRVLDSVRNEVLPYVSKLLGEIEGMSKSWKDHGRLCSPRILFLFQWESDVPRKISRIMPDEEKCWPFRENPVKKLQYKLEEEIYHILRKCRVVTNISANSLFAIPTTEEYVFIYDQGVQKIESRDSRQKIPFHLVTEFCTKRIETMSDSAHSSYKLPTEASSSNAAGAVAKPYCDTPRTYSDMLYDFRSFILAHSHLAHDSGFDDDSKRVAEHKHFFVIPTFRLWVKAFKLLSNYFLRENHHDSQAQEALDLINQYNNIDSEYLESQCAKIFPKIYAAYLKNLPEIYPEQLHQAKLTAAISMFLKVSRGPGVDAWLKKLSEKCDKYWKNGRQQCEARSLKENMCCLALHGFKVEDHLEVIPLPEMDDKLPVKPHCTGRRFVSYCNCGRSQGAREEPFTIRESNYDFYVRIGYDCCNNLDRIDFPIFVPPPDYIPDPQEMLLRIQARQQMGLYSNENYFANQVPSSQDLEDELRQGSSVDVTEYEAVNNFNEETENYNDILRDEAEAYSKSKKDEASEGEDSDTGGEKSGENGKDSHRIETKEIRAKWEAMLQQQSEEQGGRDKRELTTKSEVNVEEISGETETDAVGTEATLADENNVCDNCEEEVQEQDNTKSAVESSVMFLPGMQHSNKIPGLLPLFPSWSLVCLGSSSLYCHNSGITHQPGFLNGSSTLLPWDKMVKAEAGVSKPIPRLIRGRRPSTRVKRITDEFTVKIFLGVEYECRRGHRFILESPDKILQTSGQSSTPNLKEAATVVAQSDMPLYFPCPCKENRDPTVQIAQLVRVHVVTPKAPVHVMLNPRVQPGPSPCPIFFPGNMEPIRLTPSSYWVLRLPNSYVSEHQVYVPSRDVTSYNGKLLKGLYDVHAMSPSETKDWELENNN